MLRLPVLLFAALATSVPATASAVEVKVLTAGAYKSVVVALQKDFESATGHKLIIDNGTAGQLAKRINDGEAFDVAIITPAVIKELADGGKVKRESAANVARVGIGVAVKAGTNAPDISSAAALQKALMLEKMGIAAAVSCRAGSSRSVWSTARPTSRSIRSARSWRYPA